MRRPLETTSERYDDRYTTTIERYDDRYKTTFERYVDRYKTTFRRYDDRYKTYFSGTTTAGNGQVARQTFVFFDNADNTSKRFKSPPTKFLSIDVRNEQDAINTTQNIKNPQKPFLLIDAMKSPTKLTVCFALLHTSTT